MPIGNLLMKGPEGRGALEKFADGCTAMARAFWTGREVKVVHDGKTCTFRASERLNATGVWFFVPAILTAPVYPVGLVLFPVFAVAYLIACIPILAAMGVGLIAKKYALSHDENSRKYNDFVKKFLTVADPALKRAELEKKNAPKEAEIRADEQMLEDIRYIRQRPHDADAGREARIRAIEDHILIGKQTAAEGRLLKTRPEVERLRTKISGLTERISQVRPEWERMAREYLASGHEQPSTIRFTVQGGIEEPSDGRKVVTQTEIEM